MTTQDCETRAILCLGDFVYNLVEQIQIDQVIPNRR